MAVLEQLTTPMRQRVVRALRLSVVLPPRLPMYEVVVLGADVAREETTDRAQALAWFDELRTEHPGAQVRVYSNAVGGAS